MSSSGFGSSFLPKEESVTAAPEVEVNEDYQASSQVSRLYPGLTYIMSKKGYFTISIIGL